MCIIIIIIFKKPYTELKNSALAKTPSVVDAPSGMSMRLPANCGRPTWEQVPAGVSVK